MEKIKKNKGQIMLMSVLLICGAILGVTALASTLVMFQIKKSASAGESAQAIFAADAGIETALWERYHGGGPISACKIIGGSLGEEYSLDPISISGVDDNRNVRYTVRFQDCNHASSLGESGRSARAFSVTFDGLCEFGGQLDPTLCELEDPPAGP